MGTVGEGLGALLVLMLVLGFMAYTQAPKHWQTPLGFIAIVFVWMPAGLLLLALFKEPLLLIPAVFILGAVMVSKRA